MTTDVRNSTNWKNLCAHEDVNGVVVETREGDRFVLTLQDAINACKSAADANAFLGQLEGVFERINAWLNERTDKIDRAYLSLGDEGLDFTVVQRSGGFDPEVDEPLVELDISIAQSPKFDLIRLDVMSLPYSPEETVRSFVRPHPTWMRRLSR